MKKYFKKYQTILVRWKFWLIALFLIVITSIFLRLYRLTYLPIFADEAIYIRWAQVMKAESTLRFLPLSDGKQPLFMWVVIPFLKIFSDPVFAGRFVSVLTSIGTLLGITTASYFLFKNRNIALMAAFLYALSPFSVFFDRMALTDSMLTMFGIWIFTFAILSARNLRLDISMLTGFILGGALLTKSPALFFSLLIPTTLLLKFRKQHFTQILKYILKVIPILIPTYIIGYGMLNILRLGPNFHLLKLRNADYVYPFTHLLTSPQDPFFAHLKGIFDYFIKMGPWPIVLLFALGLFVGLKRYKKELILLFLWGLIPILVNSEFAKVMTARYVLFSIPFLYIIAALTIDTKVFLKKIVYVLLLLFLLLSLNYNRLLLTDVDAVNLPQSERSGYLEEWTAGTGIKEVAEYIKNYNKNYPDKNIVIGTEGYFGTLPDGLQIYLNNLQGITTIGVGLNFYEIPDSLTSSFKAGNATFLVINQSRFLLNQENSKHLELIYSYPKAFRKIGSREYNLYGPSDSLLFFKLK